MPEQNDPWCRDCCTIHEKDGNCPGELLATGPERHGFRVMVELPRGPEIYGTLVAPAGDRWRARILTFPNILWVIPKGGTMKFIASSPAEAQDKAVEYIRQQCKRRGLALRAEVTRVESGEVDPEQDAKTARSEAVLASQRQLHSLRIRYGMGRPTDEAETDDLSEGGLFIRTDSPLSEGTNLALRLEIEGFNIPMQGVVRWVREEEKDGRPSGMGVKLVQPHPRYVHYIRQKRGAPEPAKYELEEWKGEAAK
jgi:uncharacterized protein (TIGR02266 family)